jgi:hypothetical protein
MVVGSTINEMPRLKGGAMASISKINEIRHS